MSLDLTETDTLVVGAGQAGVAMSEHLGKPEWLMEIDVIAVIPDGWVPPQA